MASPIISLLSTYSGKYAPGLIGQLFNSLKDAEISILENIKVDTKFAKLSIGAGLKPYSATFSPSDDLTYTDRTLSPKLAKRELLIEPAKYQTTFMAETTDKNSKYYNLPEENYIWMKVIEALVDEVIMNVIYNGDTTSVVPAEAVADGFEKHILALIGGGQAPVATGALDQTNACAKFDQFYRDAMAANPEWRQKAMNLYCSWANFDNFNIDYKSEYQYDPQIFSDQGKPVYLKPSMGKVKVTPVAWLGSSNRIILTPKENLVLGTDKLSDMNVINTIPDVWTLKAGIRFLIGLQIIDKEAIWFNDQA